MWVEVDPNEMAAMCCNMEAKSTNWESLEAMTALGLESCYVIFTPAHSERKVLDN